MNNSQINKWVTFVSLILQEEVSQITMNKYRKAQQQIEEAEHRADMAERTVTVRRLGPGGRAGSVVREMSVVTTRGARATSMM